MASPRKPTSTSTENRQVLDQACRFNEVVDLIGPRWKMQVLFSISEQLNRFSLLKQAYPMLSDQVLGRRLRELEADGLIQRVVDAQVVPTAISYEVLPKAQALLELVPLFCAWGDQWLPA